MLRKFYSATLACILILPEVLLAQQTTTHAAALKYSAAPTTASSAQSSAQGQTPQSVRPQSSKQRRSYEREVRPRHRSTRISKGEMAFMAGIAGTSMGIGAIAGGGVGLAIGAIVGGWGAYVGHRIWNYVK